MNERKRERNGMRKCFANELRAHAASLLINIYFGFGLYIASWKSWHHDIDCICGAHVSWASITTHVWKIDRYLKLPQHRCCHRHCRIWLPRSTLIKCFLGGRYMQTHIIHIMGTKRLQRSHYTLKPFIIWKKLNNNIYWWILTFITNSVTLSYFMHKFHFRLLTSFILRSSFFFV